MLYPEQCWAARASTLTRPVVWLPTESPSAALEPVPVWGSCGRGVPVAVCEPYRQLASAWVWALKPDLPPVSQALPTADSDLR